MLIFMLIFYDDFYVDFYIDFYVDLLCPELDRPHGLVLFGPMSGLDPLTWGAPGFPPGCPTGLPPDRDTELQKTNVQ